MDTLFEFCYIYTVFFIMFSAAGLVAYITEKSGFSRWLRGWSWYFGLVDSEKEPEYTDEEIPGFFDRKKDR